MDPADLTFAFRPLWQLSAAERAGVALQKAQATQVYAGLNLWPAATLARLVQAQLAEDGTYPGAATVFAEADATTPSVSNRPEAETRDFFPVPFVPEALGAAAMTPTSRAIPMEDGRQEAAPPVRLRHPCRSSASANTERIRSPAAIPIPKKNWRKKKKSSLLHLGSLGILFPGCRLMARWNSGPRQPQRRHPSHRWQHR